MNILGWFLIFSNIILFSKKENEYVKIGYIRVFASFFFSFFKRLVENRWAQPSIIMPRCGWGRLGAACAEGLVCSMGVLSVSF